MEKMQSAEDVQRTQLLNTALREIATNFRSQGSAVPEEQLMQDARSSLNDSLQLARQHHAENPPTGLTRNPLLDRPNLPESLRHTLEAQDAAINKILLDNHRSRLASLFTISGVSQDVAERLVDSEILKQRAK